MPPLSRRTPLRWLALALFVLAGLVLMLRPRVPAPTEAASRETLRGAPEVMPAPSNAPPVPATAARLAAAPVSRPLLFTYVQPANAAELDAALHAPAQRIYYVRLDEGLIAGKQSPFWQKMDEGRLTLPLPDGGSLAVAIHDSEMLGPQRFTSTGTIEGRPGSRAIFAYNEGFLHATVEDVGIGSYELRAATDGGLEQFYQVDPSLVPPCGGEVHPVMDSDALTELEKRAVQPGPPRTAMGAGGGSAEESTPSVAADSAGLNVVVHVMMLYTQGVRFGMAEPQRTAAIQSDFDVAIAQVNDDFARSLVSARVKLVKIAAVDYIDPASRQGDELTTIAVNWQANMLTALRDTSDGVIDEIHPLRDQVGADLVCLVQNRPDSSSSGIAYVMDTPDDSSNPLFGFSVVGYDFLNPGHTFSHELGHNFGNAHARGDPQAMGTKDGAYTYSYGYRFTGQDGRAYHDIMAYDPGTRIFYFSNPNLTAPAPISAPLGIAVGLAGETNAALTIDQSAFEVANYRLQTQTDASNGTLVNVATRAFAGTGEQQLIAGFIIAGTQPKKMLIRAAGPALLPFGVSGVLPDPKLTLNRTDISTGNPIAVNATGWETQTGAGGGVTANDIATAVPGAFAFAKGSKDAALLVTLAPGNYTANVESVSGATGAALVEAYEVDRNDNKLVNLSTRAYAAKGNEIFGGFIVQGDPGTTKRILIRARGPSLAQFGITNPLNDPYMGLYNANSTLIMANDDWSTGEGSTAGLPDDAKPTVATYNEQQISATGLAPGNRREPCIMADLPPGSYTAIVQPFELLPSQPAQSGVGIIEVYEINP